VIYTSGSSVVVFETQFPHNVSKDAKDFVEISGATERVVLVSVRGRII
jgi:hypothetical protein